MVSKSTLLREPDPLDESWWAAILAEEEKYLPSGAHQANPKEMPSEKEPVANRPSQKNNIVDWQLAQALFEKDEPITLQVTGYNRGGLLVGGEGLHGFVPVSHLVDFDCLAEEKDRDKILEDYVEKPLNLKIIECDAERGRVVFSERAALAASGRRNRGRENRRRRSRSRSGSGRPCSPGPAAPGRCRRGSAPC